MISRGSYTTATCICSWSSNQCSCELAFARRIAEQNRRNDAARAELRKLEREMAAQAQVVKNGAIAARRSLRVRSEKEPRPEPPRRPHAPATARAALSVRQFAQRVR